jgi:Holliday junction resolvase RusA-like endonuclease
MTAAEFRKAMSRGLIKTAGKKIVVNDVSDEYLETIDKIDSIWIPGEVYSSKNNKRIFTRSVRKSKWLFSGKPVMPFISDSAAVTRYKKEKLGYYIANREKFLKMAENKPFPLHVNFQFVRRTRGKWDFNNMTELVQDMMVLAGWINDDDVSCMIPVYKKHMIGSKPGVMISL